MDKSLFIKNLKRRIRYLTKHYGASGIPSVSSELSVKELRSISSKVRKSLDKGRRDKLLSSYELAGNSIRNPAVTEKGVRAQINRDKERKQAKERKLRDFENRVNKIVKKVREYNKDVPFSKPSELLHIAPKNERELKLAEKIVKNLKNKKTVSELLKRRPKESPLSASTRKFSNGLYMAYVYTQTSIEQAYGSALPELGDLFTVGGVTLVEELREEGFTLFEYANSLTDTESDSETVLLKLASTIPFLSPRNQEIVKHFVEKVGNEK